VPPSASVLPALPGYIPFMVCGYRFGYILPLKHQYHDQSVYDIEEEVGDYIRV
jgi:hypothetical protein